MYCSTSTYLNWYWSRKTRWWILTLAVHTYLVLIRKTTKVKVMFQTPSYIYALWYAAEEIWCTRKSLDSFRLEFDNCLTQFTLSQFQDFEQKRCVYWIVYLTFWNLVDISFLDKCLFLIYHKAKVIFDSFKVFIE